MWCRGLLVGVLCLLTPAHGEINCKGINGAPGQAGRPGRDGEPGPKGEKGEPGAMPQVDNPLRLQRLKGDTGSPGPPGPMGPKGYHGEVGAMGSAGAPGAPGRGGNLNLSGEHLEQRASVFSVKRTSPTYPAIGKVVTYETTLINKPGDFNAREGLFTCSIPGIYYFTFQAMAKVSMCLRIASTPPFNKLGFCDYNRNMDQVLTGGVVLQLRAQQQVWLESFKENQRDDELRDRQEKTIIFNGFLIYAV